MCGKLSCFSASLANGYISGTACTLTRWSIMEGEEGFPLREVIWSIFVLFAWYYAVYFASSSSTVLHRLRGGLAWWSNLGWRWIFVFFFATTLSLLLQLTDWWRPEGARSWTDWLTELDIDYSILAMVKGDPLSPSLPLPDMLIRCWIPPM